MKITSRTRMISCRIYLVETIVRTSSKRRWNSATSRGKMREGQASDPSPPLHMEVACTLQFSTTSPLLDLGQLR